MVTDSALREVRDEIRAAHAQAFFAGIVFAAGDARGIQAIGAEGYAAMEPERVAMTPTCVFDLASVTKVVATATACAICRDLGLLDVEAPISTYLPGLKPLQHACPRVRDLATHTSGYDNHHFDREPSSEALLRAVLEAPPRWPPGTRYEYSCRNFILLSLIVERVSGRAFGEFCDASIFRPLGLQDTAFGPLAGGASLVATECPAGVISDGQARLAGRPVGNAGLFSTAADLARFAQMMLRGGDWNGSRLLSPETFAVLVSPLTVAPLPRRGFGWDLRPPEECPHRPLNLSRAAFGHGGWTGNSLWIDPARDRFLILLSNRTHPQANAQTKDRADLARGRIGTLLLEALQA
jgi:CubicO group peptidase (beta-lactamase class C family)